MSGSPSCSRPKYCHVVSLGFFCSTALELKRYGLRDGSYPFDWVICSRPESVLHLLESGFGDILQAENLQRDSVYPYIVHDLRLGIDLYHDFDQALPVADQIALVRDKYERRTLRLKEATAEPTLFVRYISGLREYQYLHENMPSVLALLRKSNPGNDVLLVGNLGIPAECAGIPVHRVAIDDGDEVAREFVRKNRELHRTLLMLRYPLGRRARNYPRYRRDTSRRQPLSVSVRSGAWRVLSAVLGEDRLTGMVARQRVAKSASAKQTPDESDRA